MGLITKKRLAKAKEPIAPEIDQEIKDILAAKKAKRLFATRDISENPKVSSPSGFQPDPPTIGSPEFQEIAKETYDLLPEAKERISRIQQHPTDQTFRELIRSDLDLADFPRTNLLGIYGLHDHQIGVNPRLEGPNLAANIMHETGHAGGMEHGRDMENLEGLARMKYDLKNTIKPMMNQTKSLLDPEEYRRRWDEATAKGKRRK